MAMPLEVMMRFGLWDEILAEPHSRIMSRFPARSSIMPGPSHTRQRRMCLPHEGAGGVPAGSQPGAGGCSLSATIGGADILDVAESFMRGEILYRAGKIEEGLSALREAVALEDRLRYDEPPDWIIPVRHALGAALLKAGNFAKRRRSSVRI